MSTRIGFYLFAGLLVGAFVGQWLPFIATVETVAGGVIAVLLGLLIDRVSAKKARKSED